MTETGTAHKRGRQQSNAEKSIDAATLLAAGATWENAGLCATPPNRILRVVGAPPNFMKMAPIVNALAARGSVDTQLGQGAL